MVGYSEWEGGPPSLALPCLHSPLTLSGTLPFPGPRPASCLWKELCPALLHKMPPGGSTKSGLLPQLEGSVSSLNLEGSFSGLKVPGGWKCQFT